MPSNRPASNSESAGVEFIDEVTIVPQYQRPDADRLARALAQRTGETLTP
jgi:hypothetical protein